MKFREIFLQRLCLDDYPKHDLPKGYYFRFYQQGDETAWQEIFKSSDPYNIATPILFNQYFVNDEIDLEKRQVFPM